VLRGNFIAKVDEKGRLKMPAQFRAEIEPQYGAEFFVTSFRGENARIYPMDVWRGIEEKISRAPSLNPVVARFKTLVNYYGQCALMDGQGRVLIHPLLREKAGIRGEVAVFGQQDHLEVWNRSSLEERLESEPLTDSELADLANLLGI
jgi:MraZ protein